MLSIIIRIRAYLLFVYTEQAINWIVVFFMYDFTYWYLSRRPLKNFVNTNLPYGLFLSVQHSSLDLDKFGFRKRLVSARLPVVDVVFYVCVCMYVCMCVCVCVCVCVLCWLTILTMSIMDFIIGLYATDQSKCPHLLESETFRKTIMIGCVSYWSDWDGSWYPVSGTLD